MEDVYNFDLNVEQDSQYQLQADTSETHAMDLDEAINVIIQQGGKIYYDTRAAWDMQPQLIAEREAIYVYSDKAVEYDAVGNPKFIPGIKVGDGTSYLIDMAFVGDEILIALAQHMTNNVVHITAAERTFWNNKVSSFIDEHDSETLVLSKITFMED